MCNWTHVNTIHSEKDLSFFENKIYLMEKVNFKQYTYLFKRKCFEVVALQSHFFK